MQRVQIWNRRWWRAPWNGYKALSQPAIFYEHGHERIQNRNTQIKCWEKWRPFGCHKRRLQALQRQNDGIIRSWPRNLPLRRVESYSKGERSTFLRVGPGNRISEPGISSFFKWEGVRLLAIKVFPCLDQRRLVRTTFKLQRWLRDAIQAAFDPLFFPGIYLDILVHPDWHRCGNSYRNQP